MDRDAVRPARDLVPFHHAQPAGWSFLRALNGSCGRLTPLIITTSGDDSFIPHDDAVLLRPFCPSMLTMAKAVNGTTGRRFSLPINLLGVRGHGRRSGMAGYLGKLTRFPLPSDDLSARLLRRAARSSSAHSRVVGAHDDAAWTRPEALLLKW